jgi:hypothetical protein
MGRRLAGLALVLLASCGTAAGCAEPGWDDRIVDERVSGAMTKSLTRLSASRPGYPGVPMRTLTPFSWDGLFVFDFGPQGKNVREKTGFSFMPDDEYVQENEYLLVFAKGSSLAKVVLLKDRLAYPLSHTTGKKYSSQVRMISVDGGRVMELVEPTAFQRLYDVGPEDRIFAKVRALRAERGTSFPVGDLGFAWDELRVIEPAKLKEETGLSYAGLKYRPRFTDFMVFSERNRIVRITEMSDVLFLPKDRKEVYGRKWSKKVLVVLKNKDSSTFTLREP